MSASSSSTSAFVSAPAAVAVPSSVHPSHSSFDSVAASASSIHAPFVHLSRETRELYLRGSGVAVLSSPPSPLSFYRDFVSANLPVLVRGAVDDWPALERWRSNAYLRRAMGEQLVSVACTPHGRADSVQDGVMMLPCEERWAFGRFMDYIDSHKDGQDGQEVCYLQAQNASFSSEYGPLHDDVGPLEWASVAFNDAPDAVNLWMGNSASLTALHQDNYENVYAVLSGSKTFLLFPPTDLYWLLERHYPIGRYVRATDGALQPTTDEQAAGVPWVVDVEQQLRDMERRQQRGEDDEDEEQADDGSEEEAEAVAAPDELTVTEEMRRTFGKSASLRGRLEPSISHYTDSTAQRNTMSPHRSLTPLLLPAVPSVSVLAVVSARLVEVRAGEVLYLPCLWFHCVAQHNDEEGKCVALNMWSARSSTKTHTDSGQWQPEQQHLSANGMYECVLCYVLSVAWCRYDMRYDHRWAMHQHLRRQVNDAYRQLSSLSSHTLSMRATTANT